AGSGGANVGGLNVGILDALGVIRAARGLRVGDAIAGAQHHSSSELPCQTNARPEIVLVDVDLGGVVGGERRGSDRHRRLRNQLQVVAHAQADGEVVAGL